MSEITIRRGRPRKGEEVRRPQKEGTMCRTSVQLPHRTVELLRREPGYSLAENIRVDLERWLFLAPRDDGTLTGLAEETADLAERAAMRRLQRGDFRFFVLSLVELVRQHMLEHPEDADRALPLLAFLETATAPEKMLLLDAIVGVQRRKLEAGREAEELEDDDEEA